MPSKLNYGVKIAEGVPGVELSYMILFNSIQRWNQGQPCVEGEGPEDKEISLKSLEEKAT